MKVLLRAAVWIAVFMVVLLLRLPYETILTRVITSAEGSTGVSITWDEMSMGLTGINLNKLLVTIPSGGYFTADKAFVGYSLSGLSVDFTQYDSAKVLAEASKRSGSQTAENSAKSTAPSSDSSNRTGSVPGTASLRINASELAFKSDNLALDTGSKDLKAVRLGGQLTYNYLTGKGKGTLDFKVPSLKGSLPVELNNLEIGANITIEPYEAVVSSASRSSDKAAASAASKSTSVNSRLTLYSQDVTGEGSVTLRSVPQNSSPVLNGDLTFKTKMFGTHKVNISGTWANPEWNLAGAR
ncbi:MAG: hypothetical protein ACI38Q_07980 [Candidatus Bruticola sp.]